MIIILFFVGSFLISETVSQNCCAQLFEDPVYKGKSISYCSCKRCISLPPEWQDTVSSVRLIPHSGFTDYFPTARLYVDLYCNGASELVERFTCGGNLHKLHPFHILGFHTGFCKKGIGDRIKSLRIYPEDIPNYGRYTWEYDIKLYTNFRSVQSQLAEGIRKTSELLEQLDQLQPWNDITSALPYVSNIAWIVPILKMFFIQEDQWQKDIHNFLPELTQIYEARTTFESLKSKMEVVVENLNLIRDGNFSNDSVAAITHTIHNNLFEVTSLVDSDSGIFKQHPMLAIKPLFLLTPLVVTFYSMLPAELKISSTMFSKYCQMVRYFERPYMRARVFKLHIPNVRDVWLHEVINETYNKNGYFSYGGDERIFCLDWSCHREHFQCMEDTVNEEPIYSQNRDCEACFKGYARLVRWRFEKEYTTILDLCIKIKK